MISRENILIVVPAVLASILLIFAIVGNPSLRKSVNSLTMTEMFYSSDSCADCPDAITETSCSDSSYPVLGGLDFVQYFTEFKNDDGTYDETKLGEVGSSEYSSTYNGYTFYFKSSDNKALFDAAPDTYLPQYGGFCSWGMSGEYCPQYPWSASCLGPSGNWGHWTIQDSRLFFFLFSEAKNKFMSDVDTNIANGDTRWSSWFPADSYFNTQCYVTTVTDETIKPRGSNHHLPPY